MGAEERVIGPPGCGKTTHCVAVAAEAAARYGATKVMICSLTVAAAQNIATRVAIEIPAQNIGTLHSLCYRALGSPDMFLKRVSEWNTRVEAPYRLSEVNGASGLEGVLSTATLGDAAFAADTLRRMRMGPPHDDVRFRNFSIEWKKWKDEFQIVDFTDMIELSYLNIDSAPNDPAVIIIDEAQDMSRLEYALIRKWGDKAQKIVLVGDAHQGIFGFRGAEPECFYEGDGEITTLSKSYRVPREVHRGAMYWMGKSKLPPVEYHPRDFDGELSRSKTQWESVEEWLPGALARDGSIMILASCIHMLNPVINQFRAMGCIWGNPYRPEYGPWNPLGGGRALRSFLAPDGSANPEPRAWTYADMKAWTEPIKADGNIHRGAKTTITDIPKGQDNQPFPVEFLPRVFTAEAVSRALAYDVGWWRSQFTPSWARRNNLAYLCSLSLRSRSAAFQVPRIIIGTIHSVKGGEADHVYCSSQLSAQAWEQWRFGDREATIRAMYVATTRARQTFTMVPTCAKASVIS